jgi:hypothetical protein
LLAFAADAGAFAALGGQHAGVAGVGITPAQAGLQLAGQRGVIPVVRATHHKGAYRTELRLDRIGPGCVRAAPFVERVTRSTADIRDPADASNTRAELQIC